MYLIFNMGRRSDMRKTSRQIKNHKVWAMLGWKLFKLYSENMRLEDDFSTPRTQLGSPGRNRHLPVKSRSDMCQSDMRGSFETIEDCLGAVMVWKQDQEAESQ